LRPHTRLLRYIFKQIHPPRTITTQQLSTAAADRASRPIRQKPVFGPANLAPMTNLNGWHEL